MKKNFYTLKRLLTEVTLGAFLMTVALTLGAVWVFSLLRKNSTYQENVKELTRNANNQIEQLIPSFLLIEQKDALELLLQKIKRNEKLVHALFFMGADLHLPKTLELCPAPTNEFTFCVNEELGELSVIFPIIESGMHLGYLVKTRSLSKEWGSSDLIVVVAIFLGSLIFTLAITYLLLARTFSRRIPQAVDHLVEWIKADLENRPTTLQQLPFKEFEVLKEKITQVMDRHNQVRAQALMGQMAAQVSHDIRSPLAALDMLTLDLTELSEDKRKLLKTAVSRIKDIANSLLKRQRESLKSLPGLSQDMILPREEPKSVQLLTTLIESIVTEKRIQFRSKRNLEISLSQRSNSFGIFANVQPIEFKRMMSNVIDNAVDSIESHGRIEIAVNSVGSEVVISVKDNGKGIDPKLLPSLGNRGVTFGKRHGSGLGLHHVKQTIARMVGSYSIDSAIGSGTTLEMRLPRASRPAWFLSEILVPPGTGVVIVDDDSSIHDVWKGRLIEESRNGGICPELVHLMNPKQLYEFLDQNPLAKQNALFLIDYEFLCSNENGLKLIESLDLSKRSTLVTSYFEELAIQKKCLQMGLKLMPKSMIHEIPVTLVVASDC